MIPPLSNSACRRSALGCAAVARGLGVALLCACGGGGASRDGDLNAVQSVEPLPCEHARGAPIVVDGPAVPPCATGSPVLALPGEVTVDASGGIELRPSGWMQPVGELERIAVLVRHPGGALDKGASGELAAKAGPGVEVVATEAVQGGRGAVSVRLHREGVGRIEVALANDGRQGTAALHGYTSELPIWILDVQGKDWQAMLATPDATVWAPCTLRIDGVKWPGKVRLHGGSSRDYPKKSLRFNLAGAGPSELGNRLILRAEWRDKSMLRAWLAMSLIRDLTPLPISSAGWVHLRRSDGIYLGLMLRIERVDQRFLRRRGLSPSGDLFEPDPPPKLAIPGGNLTPLSNPADYPLIYQHHGGRHGYAPLRELIEQTLQLDDAGLEQELPKVLDVPRLMLYLAVMAVLQNQDHIKKNYYLYRDPDSADCRWQMLAWDLDLTFGNLWNAQEGLLGDEISHDGDPMAGRNVGHSYFNQLIDRAFAVPAWRKLFDAYLADLIERVDSDFVKERIQAALCATAPDLLADRAKRAANSELHSRFDELVAFVQSRRAYLSQWLQQAGAGG